MKIHSIKVDAENIYSPREILTEILHDKSSTKRLNTWSQKYLAFYQDSIVQEYARLMRRVMA